jgi:hypothetical protein
MVVYIIDTSIPRDYLQPRFPAIPENTHKTLQNPEIYVDRPLLPVEICSAHQNSLERV